MLWRLGCLANRCLRRAPLIRLGRAALRQLVGQDTVVCGRELHDRGKQRLCGSITLRAEGVIHGGKADKLAECLGKKARKGDDIVVLQVAACLCRLLGGARFARRRVALHSGARAGSVSYHRHRIPSPGKLIAFFRVPLNFKTKLSRV